MILDAVLDIVNWYSSVFLNMIVSNGFSNTIFIIGILFIIFLLIQQNTYAFTYKTIWWLGYLPNSPPEQAPANLRLYFTYPDRVYAGQKFGFGMTIEYIKDKNAKLNWILFSNVSVGIRDYASAHSSDIKRYTDYNDSTLIKPGEFYSKSFTFTAPKSPGKYLLFPAWNAFYGPGTTAAINFQWDMDAYYDRPDRDEGNISPDTYHSISVVDRNSLTNKKESSALSVKVDPPFGNIKPFDVRISNKTYTATNGGISIELPVNSNYSVRIPRIIDIVPGNIRAVFVNWSDGQGSIVRNSTLYHDEELYAIYETQYHLKVRSMIGGDNTKGTGWYYSDSEAPFSVNPFAGFPILHSFDHWIGDLSGEHSSSTSGSLSMDGPKEIIATWKFDFTYLAAIIGCVSAALSILGKFHPKNIHRFIGSLVRSVSYRKMY